MSIIKPIETRYKGYHFRSRLEARWAVFFDALHIKWEYEPEGYRLNNGKIYLPDFRFYSSREGTEGRSPLFGEVKPLVGNYTQFNDSVCLIKSIPEDATIICLGGQPDTITYPIYQKCEGEEAWGDVAINGDHKYAPWYWMVRNADWENWAELEILDLEGNTLKAIYAARSARFEFGESGAT